MEHTLKILMLEDSKTDAEIIQRLLLKQEMKCEFSLAMTQKSFLLALEEFIPDIKLSDNSLPRFNATDALKITRQRYPHIPFILVTGTVSEEYSADIIKLGADDYILKDRMARLPAAIEAALKQRKALKEIADYKYALDESSDVTITDQKGIIAYANENFCKISQYTSEELIGKDHRITNSGYHPASFIKNLWVTIARGRIWHGEFRNKAKDGSFYWEDTTVVPFLDQKGKPYQYLAIRADITKRKEAEEELLQSEMKLKEAQAIAHIGNWEVDLELNINTWSDEFYRIFGLTKGEVQPSPELFLSFLHPDDAAYGQKNVQEAFETSKNSSFEFRFIRKDGITRHGYSEWRFEFNKKGKAVRLFGILQDITERKKAEEELSRNELRFRTLTSNAPVGIFQTDAVGKTLYVNDTWLKYTGLTFHEAMGDGWQEVLHPDDKEKQLKQWEDKSKKGFESSSEFRLIDKKGNTRWVIGKATPLFNTNRQITGYIGTLSDLTESKEAEENLKLLEKKIQEQKIQEQKKITRANIKAQEKERNRIGQELHDNVNQILAGTKLFLDMAGKEDVKTKELIKYPMELIDSCIHEIRLLSHSQVTPLKDVNLKELIQSLLDNVSKNTTIKTGFIYKVTDEAIDDDLKLNVYRIIQEQINNIVKYAAAGNIRISIETAKKNMNISVADDGKGFDVSKKRKGIGISNMINRIESFNGEITIESSPDNGCTMQAKIPY